MKLLIILSCFVSFASAGSYTSALNLYKPAFGDTNYVTPFSTGMDTLDSAIPDKRTTKTAVFDSSVTINTPFTVKSSVTITGSVGMSATGASVTTISSASITSAQLINVAQLNSGALLNTTTHQMPLTWYSTMTLTFTISGTTAATTTAGYVTRVGKMVMLTLDPIYPKTKNTSNGYISLSTLPTEYRQARTHEANEYFITNSVGTIVWIQLNANGVISFARDSAGNTINANTTNCGWDAMITLYWTID